MPTVRFLDCSPLDGEERVLASLPAVLDMPSFETKFAVPVEESDAGSVHTEARRFIRVGFVPERLDASGKPFSGPAVLYAWEKIMDWVNKR